MPDISVAEYMANLDRMDALAMERNAVALAASRAPEASPAVSTAPGFELDTSLEDGQLDGALLTPGQRRKLEGRGYEFTGRRPAAIPIMKSPKPIQRSRSSEGVASTQKQVDTTARSLSHLAAARRDDPLDGSLLSPSQLKRLRDRGMDVAGPGER